MLGSAHAWARARRALLQGSANHGASISYAEGDCPVWPWHGKGDLAARPREPSTDPRTARRLWGDCDYRAAGFTFLARPGHAGWRDDRCRLPARDYELLFEDGFAVAGLDADDTRRITDAATLSSVASPIHTDAQFHSGKYVVGLAKGVVADAGVRLVRRGAVTGSCARRCHSGDGG